MPASQIWRCVEWSPTLNLYVAVGDSATAGWSTDGVNWSTSTLPSSGQWNQVVWIPAIGVNAAKFVTFKANSSVGAYSTDGKNWTQMSALPAAPLLWGGCASNGSIIILLQNSATSNVVNTSTDGINWTAHAAAMPSAEAWNEVNWSSTLNLFVAVAGTGQASTVAATSPDGVTWTARTLPTAAYWRCVRWNSIARLWGASDFNNPNTNFATSPDGVNWTLRTLPLSANWANLCYSVTLNLFLLTGFATTKCMTSPDGVTWTQRTMPASRSWYGCVWGTPAGVNPGTFVVVAADVATPAAAWIYGRYGYLTT